jgi:hypothetical protein
MDVLQTFTHSGMGSITGAGVAWDMEDLADVVEEGVVVLVGAVVVLVGAVVVLVEAVVVSVGAVVVSVGDLEEVVV